MTRDYWRSLLAENVKWAACEPFIQGSLRGAFNCRSGGGCLIADREKRVRYQGGELQADLLTFRPGHEETWLKGRGKPGVEDCREKLCRGLVQMKVVWTEGN